PNLNRREQDIVQAIDSYFPDHLELPEKLKLARLLAQIDLEFDPAMADRGKYTANEIIKVAQFILAGL
ncbi:MAG TPA: hypothetical protein VNU93_04760, partial [Verrucomicrobiae bacterium]|nr:hypothetical protein [Verrucomicrobiae bacterium]